MTIEVLKYNTIYSWDSHFESVFVKNGKKITENQYWIIKYLNTKP